MLVDYTNIEMFEVSEVASVRCIDVPMTAWSNFLRKLLRVVDDDDLGRAWRARSCLLLRSAAVIDHGFSYAKPLIEAEK
jgi:hypothetical protein